MKKWLRRIRGAVGMGLIWAAAWFGAGVIFLSGLLVFGSPPVGTGLVAVIVMANSVLLAVFGFVGGTAFSVILGIAEGRRRFDEMSLPVFAGIGGTVGGLLASVVSLSTGGPFTLSLVGVSGIGAVFLLGAGSAAGSLALARRADDRELLEHGEDVADIGLTEEEKHALLLGN